jgi:hypothetical protein
MDHEEEKAAAAPFGATRGARSESVADGARQAALARLGVFVPKSKEEEAAAALVAEIAQLKAALERERAQRFHDEQEWRSRKQDEGASQSEEMAGLSRKLHEQRVAHKEELARVKETALNDMVEQVQKGKGPVYKRMQEELNAQLQNQLNAGKGDLLERFMIAARAQVAKEVAGSKGASGVYRDIRSVIEADLERDLELRQGTLYERLERDIRGRVLGDVAAERASERARLEGLERELHLRCEAFEAAAARRQAEASAALRAAVEGEHARLRGELTSQLAAQERQFLERYAGAVDAVSAEWAARLRARELEWAQDLLRREQERDSGAAAALEAAKRQAGAVLEQVVAASARSAEQSLAALKQHLDALQAAERRWGDAVQAQVREGGEALERTLEAHRVEAARAAAAEEQRARQQGAAAEAALAAGRDAAEQRELAQRQALEHARAQAATLLAQERDAFHASLGALAAAREGDRAAFTEALRSEQRRVAAEHAAQLAQVQASFAQLTHSLHEQRAAEQARLSARESELLAQGATMESARLRAAADTRREADQAADARWGAVLQGHAERWREDEAQRRADLLELLERRHALVVDQMQRSLVAAHDLQQCVEQAWARRAVQNEEQAREREQQFKQVCKALFETRMDDFARECAARFELMHAAALQQQAEQAEVRCQLEQRTLRARAEAAKAQTAHAAELERKHEAALADLTARHCQEVRQLAERLQRAHEEAAALRGLFAQGTHRNVVDRIKDSHDLLELRREIKQQEQRRSAGTKLLDQHRASALQLWASLRMGPPDYAPLLLKMLGAATFSPELLALLEQHVDALRLKVPLLRLAAERELIKAEVRAVTAAGQANTPRAAQAAPGGIALMTPEQRLQRDALLVRLRNVTLDLQAGAKAMLEQHPGERIIYDGQDYLALLQFEAPLMPDLKLVSSAVELETIS